MGAGYLVVVQETRMKGEPDRGPHLRPYCAPMPQWGCGLWGDLGVGGTPGAGGGSTCNRGSLTTDAERAEAPGQD